MKEFNLDAALNGEPVKLACGRKAYILYDLRRYHELSEYVNGLPLNGIVMHEDNWDKKYPANWSLSGENIFDRDSIIGMWEEPIDPKDLPKPFKPATQEQYFTITSKYKYDPLCIEETTNFSSPIDNNLINQGNAFRTREDAQKWLDFMKSMME
nr:MAG TPA: hypothetical protein [Caudoviricetes sp.]